MLETWDAAFKTNIDIIDEQHKELFRILRDLEQMLLTNCIQYEYKDFLYTLCEIRDYVTYHFYTEEQYMMKINFPDIKRHEIDHKKFTKEVNKINYDRLKENPYEVIKEVKILVEDFIMHHMLIEDAQIGNFKKEKML